MNEPIPVRVIRYRCPHCTRTASSRARTRKHMGRCWYNPAARGCKTCKHFDRDVEGYESCAVGVDLSGRPPCDDCTYGYVGEWDSGEKCPKCNGNPEGVKAGPIVGCDRWEMWA